MADTTLLTLIQELFSDYDSTVDTSDGAALRVKVIDPFLARIGDSPLDVDIETFLVARLGEEFPTLDLGKYSGIRDLVVRSMAVMLAPYRRELNAIRKAQSLQNVDVMTRDEVQALLANFFVTMDDGAYATGPVRVYFLSPQTSTVTALTEFSTGAGLKFYPTATQSVSSTVMAFQQEGSLYYAEFTVQAAEAGTDYNVAAGDINSVSGLLGVVKVSNPYAFDTGLAAETKTEAAARAKNSITIRNLTVSRGIKYQIGEEFSWATTVQVIGYRDPEMARDVVSGPVSISGVPDQVFVGTATVDLTSGESIHIGGKTDVYVYQKDLVEDTLDLQNLTDLGKRVLLGTSGYTEQDSSGLVSSFKDDHGNFARNGVAAGDYLRLGGQTGIERADLREILAVSNDTLDIDGTLSSALSEQVYEVVRFDADDTYSYVGLYDLVAEDADGNAVTDDDGNYVQAVPGDEALTALSAGGTYVAKTANVASANASLPLLWVKRVEFLDPISLQLDDSMSAIPMADLLLATNAAAFTDGTSSATATGTVRLYYRDALNAYYPPDARFTVGARRYKPSTLVSGTAQITGGALVLDGDCTESVPKGYRVLHRGTLYTTIDDPTYDSGDDTTTVTVREDLDADGASASFSAYQGVLQAEMSQEAASGLYYVDVPVACLSVGADGNLDADSVFVVTGAVAEGWLLRSLSSVTSYSTRDRPYLAFTRWVNDNTDLREGGTAYAVRVTYAAAPDLADVQNYVDDEDNRPVAEDLLVRHFLPALVRAAFTVDSALDTTAATSALVSYLNKLSPTKNLEVSDLVGLLRDEGATYTKLPVTLVALCQQANRTWQGYLVEDRVAYSRTQHFIADEDFLTVTSE